VYYNVGIAFYRNNNANATIVNIPSIVLFCTYTDIITIDNMTSSKSTKRRKLEAELQNFEEELLDNIIEETALYENESQSIEPELSDDTESEHSNFKQQFSSTNQEIGK